MVSNTFPNTQFAQVAIETINKGKRENNLVTNFAGGFDSQKNKNVGVQKFGGTPYTLVR